MQTGYSISDYINKIKKKEIGSYSDIPQEFYNNRDIIEITRSLGMRKILRRGYDVVSNNFFVEEIVVVTNYMGELDESTVVNTFSDFKSYYDFLNGDIYNEACYYQYKFSPELIDRFNIKVDMINTQPVLDYTIDNCFPEIGDYEKEQYEEIERQMSLRKRWIKKYIECSTYKELEIVNEKHKKSQDRTSEMFYIWNYINYHGKKSYKVITQFVCSGKNNNRNLEMALCFLYDAKRVLDAYDYKGGVAQTNKRYNLRFKNTVEEIVNTKTITRDIKYFDRFTHYFCVRTDVFLNDNLKESPITSLYKYFRTFKEFGDYLKNDLSDCDFSDAILLKKDWSKYKCNSATRFPISTYTNLSKVVDKRFNRKRRQFEVDIKWYDSNDVEVCQRNAVFKYFFEFVAFLKNDLSGSDLLYCDGLQNLLDFTELNLENAKLRSFLIEKAGLFYSPGCHLGDVVEGFPVSVNNEIDTEVALKYCKAEPGEYYNVILEQKVYYITDLHLLHRIYSANAITDDDCTYVIQTIIDQLLESIDSGSVILIGGDVASNFHIFKLFVGLLRKTIDDCHLYPKVFFTLGNHELWAFPDENLTSIVSKYRRILSENNMYLLQNEVAYWGDEEKILSLSEQELEKLTDEQIREKLRKARMILLGGIGFSGYNQEFNADDGVYRNAMSREEEIIESVIFEKLHDKVCACLEDRSVIVFTHMPFKDWHKNTAFHPKIVYVNGHNHRNYFCDDGITRVYADNQVGYHSEHPRLKYLYMDKTYDWFSGYDDGIFQISREDYVNFYRGKKLQITFNRDINKLYMLKKQNYYCFIHQNASGGLAILNGGSLKLLALKNIQYYYDNMDIQIAYIKKPLDKFYEIQSQIAKAVKEIGGLGYIHGAIVDIDFYNHIYINPHDLTVTPYSALNMVEKYVYASVPALLKMQCPVLFSNYRKALSGGNVNALAIKEDDTEMITRPELYLSTDIYAASRVIKKMQKLDDNILSVWIDNILESKMLE